MWWGFHEGMGWWMLFGSLWMLLFWGALIWLIVWGIQRLALGRREVSDPMTLAKARYAKGEISREEYKRIKEDLK